VARGAGGTPAASHLADAVVYSSSSTPFATVATAVTGQTPVSGQTSPHGGYSSVTNYCLQCHAVHAYGTVVPGPFALQMAGSVTSTCATCHSLFDNGASAGAGTPVDSNAVTGKASIPGGMATASLRSAYDLGNGEYLAGGSGEVAGHQIGAPTSPDGTVIEVRGVRLARRAASTVAAATPHGDGKPVRAYYRSGVQLHSVFDRRRAGRRTDPDATIAPRSPASSDALVARRHRRGYRVQPRR
jgi:hypothetical protein